MGYELFLSPGKIGTMELRNRAVFPAMGAGLWTDEGANDRLAAYHARRARGGAALCMVEISAVHKSSKSIGNPCIYDDSFIPAFRNVAEAVHAAGGKCGVQLWHGGRQLFAKDFPEQIVAPSPIRCSEVVGETPRALTTAECWELIDAYGDAALRAKRAGMDCVEIHGAHGYLIDQFLNEYTNCRTDEFGGSFENRCRFGVEVVKNVRRKVGAEYPVLMRVNAYERCLSPGGIEIEDAVRAAKKFAKAGIDCLDISQGSYDIEDIQVPPYYYPVKYNAANAAVFKREIGLPVLCAGRLVTPELCEEVLADGQADFVGLGRVQLIEPDFVRKVQEDRVDEIMRCIGCNQGCVEHIFNEELDGVSCVFHPESGHERDYDMSPAKEKKKILVIGAGPGGLETARIAAERGHDVTVFEKSGKFGGQINVASRAPGKEPMLENMFTLALLAQRAGVTIRLNTEATGERIAKLAPDFIVVAAGARPLRLPIPGIENAHDAWKVITGEDGISGSHVVVIGGGLVALEAVEILCGQGKRVTIVEMLDEVGRGIAAYLKQHTMWMLRDFGVDVRIRTRCMSLDANFITVERDGVTETISCDAIVNATGSRSNSEVEELVKATGIPYETIGDAKKPKKILDAVWQGNALARRL